MFVPAFLFHAFIHVGDPDHTLIGVPALCVLGGFVLSRLDRARAAAATAAVAMSVLLFFSPPSGIASKCSYSAVQDIDLVTRSTFQAIERIGRAQPLVLVALDHPVSWRHLLFYFPENPVIILHGDPASANPQRPWIIRNRKRRELEPEADQIPLPAGAKVVWLLARGRGLERLLGTEGPIGTQEDLLYSEPPDGLKFRFGSYLFTVVRTPEILKEASYTPAGE